MRQPRFSYLINCEVRKTPVDSIMPQLKEGDYVWPKYHCNISQTIDTIKELMAYIKQQDMGI